MMIKEQYGLVWNYFRTRLKWIFIAVTAGFILLTVASYFLFKSNPQIGTQIMNSFQEASKDIVQNNEISVVKLFLNNLKATGIAVCFGFIPFLFIPVFSLVSNAVVIGALYSTMTLAGYTNGITLTLAGILPHGIFELPAVFLSITMGIHLCWTLCKRICLGNPNKRLFTTLTIEEKKPVVTTIKNILRTFILVIIPLLIIAALVETFITPVILKAAL